MASMNLDEWRQAFESVQAALSAERPQEWGVQTRELAEAWGLGCAAASARIRQMKAAGVPIEARRLSYVNGFGMRVTGIFYRIEQPGGEPS